MLCSERTVIMTSPTGYIRILLKEGSYKMFHKAHFNMEATLSKIELIKSEMIKNG